MQRSTTRRANRRAPSFRAAFLLIEGKSVNVDRHDIDDDRRLLSVWISCTQGDEHPCFVPAPTSAHRRVSRRPNSGPSSVSTRTPSSVFVDRRPGLPRRCAVQPFAAPNGRACTNSRGQAAGSSRARGRRGTQPWLLCAIGGRRGRAKFLHAGPAGLKRLAQLLAHRAIGGSASRQRAGGTPQRARRTARLWPTHATSQFESPRAPTPHCQA